MRSAILSVVVLSIVSVLSLTPSAPSWSIDLMAARGEKISFQGTPPSGEIRIDGYLNRPEGPGPFPAMVLLPGCGGLRRLIFDWADWYKKLGYVSVAVDSLTPRKLTSGCFSGGQHPSDQETAGDAFGALAYLRTLPFVGGQRIGLAGWSRGGAATLVASSKAFAAQAQPTAATFRLAIAFYPVPCGLAEDSEVPVLVLVGALDDYHEAPVCVERGQLLQQQGRNVDVHVYPGVYHSFDNPRADGYDRTGSGLHRNQYDPAAARDASNRILKLLFQYLQ
ncbi:MAG TPA: dienelactone hydrolase family protein [Candidatus Acidoferrales bacterium]|jgi:dienelactone hydrolase|nr:dienelactone hydrolase family protein [Candidatus Acidoferrales bacterium]